MTASNYRLKREPRKPYPIPEAIPDRGSVPWEIKNAAPGYSKCAFNTESGELHVPLTGEQECDCNVDHAASVRLHEMAHAALSPDPSKIRTSFKSRGEKFVVSQEALILAEENRADWYAYKIARQRDRNQKGRTAYDAKIDYAPNCPDPELYDQMIADGDYRELAIEALSRYDGLSQFQAAYQRYATKTSEIYNDDTIPKDVKDKRFAVQDFLYNTMLDNMSSIKQWSAHKYKKNAKSWTTQLQLGYLIDQFLSVLNDGVKDLKLKLSKIGAPPPPEAPPGADNPTTSGPTGDLDKARKRFSSGSSGQNLLDELTRSPKASLVTLEKRAKGDGSKVQWGRMDIEAPALTKKLPQYKYGWTARATDEGTIPLYMHRWAVDHAIFKSKRKSYGGTVLIDVSGSMSLTREQIEEIMIAAPASTIALYSGAGWTGKLRIVAKDGKMLNPGHSDPYYGQYDGSMGRGNQIDKPALEWLAKQEMPRIWVSDGMVVSPSHGMDQSSWRDCEKVIIPGRINKVDDADQAALALAGKMTLWR